MSEIPLFAIIQILYKIRENSLYSEFPYPEYPLYSYFNGALWLQLENVGLICPWFTVNHTLTLTKVYYKTTVLELFFFL